MHRPTLSFLLLASLPTFLSALTVPSPLTLLPQNTNITLPPHPNLTYYLPPTCYHLTTPPMPPLSASKCADLSHRGPRAHSTWIWSEIHGCALGYYLPPGAIVPLMSVCEDVIFGGIREKCATGDGSTAEKKKNAGGINVEELPGREGGGGDRGDGTAVEEGRGRYLVAPVRLTS